MKIETSAGQQDTNPVQYGGPVQDGCTLILEERSRQIHEEGFHADHDFGHEQGELAAAAICYLELALLQALGLEIAKLQDWSTIQSLKHWPWGEGTFKPKDQMRNLVRAGALIAAEIDRLIYRKRESEI